MRHADDWSPIPADAKGRAWVSLKATLWRRSRSEKNDHEMAKITFKKNDHEMAKITFQKKDHKMEMAAATAQHTAHSTQCSTALSLTLL
jgi:hypothetical protein